MKKNINVVELFAGVGGFRLGLERANKSLFKTIYANQWEPGKKVQWAAECYNKNFKDNVLVNDDIAKIKNKIPKHDLLVGGFPCQDYSVATTKAEGIKGIKGVLWWEIYDVIKKRKPKFILLENVDRLIKSPAMQRGRDFTIMIKCLMDQGYVVEWRVINAADYGYPQKRRRVFIFARKSKRFKSVNNYFKKHSLLNKAFPIDGINKGRDNEGLDVSNMSLTEISNRTRFHYWNHGVAINGNIATKDVISKKSKPTPLSKILYDGDISDEYFLTRAQEKKLRFSKSSKRIPRTSSNGHQYFYSEGKMDYPDNIKLPGRTLLTSETGLNRSTHVIYDKKNNKNRFLLPVEAERMQDFPDNWTSNINMPKKTRFFIMGNALVVGLVEKIGKELAKL